MNRPLTGIRADRKHSYHSIEQIAGVLRNMLGLEPLDRFDALKFFEEVIPDLTIDCDGGRISLREAVETCDHEGQTKWDADSGVIEIALSEETYQLLRRGHVRARSTVAHEAGHACLHADQVIRLGGMSLVSQVAFHRERIPHQACQDTEWQANAFGSALLMPAEGVRRLFSRLGRVSAQAITEAFDVSMESAAYRIGTYEKSIGIK
jgi:hypothetical protein